MNNKLFFLFIILIVSCTSEQPKNDRCACETNQSIGSQTDSVRLSKTSGYDVKGEASVDAEIKKIMNGNVKISGGYKDYDETVKITVSTIIDKFPEITDFTRYKFTMLCTYVNIICKDTSLSDSEFLKKKEIKLNQIDSLIQDLYLEKIKMRENKTVIPIIKSDYKSEKKVAENPRKEIFTKRVEDIPISNNSKAPKTFELSIIINADDKILINDKPAIFLNGSTSNFKKVEITEGVRYEVKIGNCEPVIISNPLKNERIIRCS